MRGDWWDDDGVEEDVTLAYLEVRRFLTFADLERQLGDLLDRVAELAEHRCEVSGETRSAAMALAAQVTDLLAALGSLRRLSEMRDLAS